LPQADQRDFIALTSTIVTGLQLDENGALQKLSQAKWLELKRLQELGGPWDVGWTKSVDK
jgi:hypothetical protein